MRTRHLHWSVFGLLLLLLGACAAPPPPVAEQAPPPAAETPSPPEVALPADYIGWFHLGSKVIRPEGASAVGLPPDIFGNTVDSVHVNEIGLADLRNGTRPFRDGAIFVAPFYALENPVEGIDKDGELLFVAVMEKDSARYAETGGWGFEAFTAAGERIVDLRPTCYACHSSQADNDYVFSTLDERDVAAIPADANGVFLPPDYREMYHLVSAALTPEGATRAALPPDIFGNTFEAIYANWTARQALLDGERPFPQGSLFVADFHTLAEPVAGLRAWGEQAFTAVMLKKAPGQGDDPATGDWGWAAFDAAGNPLPDLRPACIACHAPQAENDYVFTRTAR